MRSALKTLLTLGLGFLFGVACCFLIPSWIEAIAGRRPQAKLTEQLYQAREGLLALHEDTGRYPPSDNRSVTSALLGENESNHPYIDVEIFEINDAAELIDPWGTPYRFDLEYSGLPNIDSAGANQKFEGDGVPTDNYRIIGINTDIDPKRRIGRIVYFPYDEPRE